MRGEILAHCFSNAYEKQKARRTEICALAATLTRQRAGPAAACRGRECWGGGLGAGVGQLQGGAPIYPPYLLTGFSTCPPKDHTPSRGQPCAVSVRAGGGAWGFRFQFPSCANLTSGPHSDNPVSQALKRERHPNVLPLMPNSPLRFTETTIDLIQYGANL